MVHLPQGVHGWTIFATGLLIVAYRVHGIDSPRAWIEWLERQFTGRRPLQLTGGIVVLAAFTLAWFAQPQSGILWWLFAFSVGLFILCGIGLVAAQNQVRMMVVATAEAADKTIRISSIAITLLGLLWALAPWFL